MPFPSCNLTLMSEGWFIVTGLGVALKVRAPGPVKLAMTPVSASNATVHAPVPEHAPLHPVKVEPDAGLAFTVTTVPAGKLAEQLVQLMPAGELVIVP